MSQQPIIRLVDLHKSFGSLRVLSGVNIDFYPGQTTVVMGPSGTGKSVLLKHIVGLLKPDRGEVWFHDQRVDLLPEHDLVAIRRKIGFLFQLSALFDSMNVWENVRFPLVEHAELAAEEMERRAAQALKLVGLENSGQKMPADLSGGQKKRVALARAIVLEPEVVLYDEPTTGLDPIRADVINELILGLTRNLKIAGIVVTHDMHSARKIADRMVMLYDGRVVADADKEAFLKSDNEVVQHFIRGQAEQQDLDLIHHAFAARGEDGGPAQEQR